MERCRIIYCAIAAKKSLPILFFLLMVQMAHGAQWIIRCEYVIFTNTSGPTTPQMVYNGQSTPLVLYSDGYRGIDLVTSPALPASITFISPAGDVISVPTIAGSCNLNVGFWSVDGTYSTPGVSVEMYVYPQAATIADPISDCGGFINLWVGCYGSSIPNLIWEVTLTPSNPSSWQTLSNSNYGNTVYLSSLPYTATQMYGNTLTVRVHNGDYPSKNLWPQSTITIRAPSPTVSFVKHNDPLCHGQSNGGFDVKLNTYDSKIADFKIQAFDASDNPQGPQYSNVPASSINPFTTSGLPAGDYYYIVTNNGFGNCATSKSATVNLHDPSAVSVAFSTSNNNGYAVSCNAGSNGQITAIPSGGTNSYQNFAWKNSANVSVGSGATASGLAADTYSVTFTDTNGCSGSGTKTITAPSAIVPLITPVQTYNSYTVSCWNKSDGKIQASATGGAGTYTYLWNTGSTSSSISGLSVNTYVVTVTDGNSCTANKSITLTAPNAIDFSINQLTGLTCAGDLTASYKAQSVVNTIGTVSYLWSTGDATADIINKGAGTYSVTVSDGQGCSTNKSVTLADPPAFTVALQPTTNYNGSFIKCTGDNNGGLQAIVKDASNNATTAQDYLWTKNGANAGESPTLTSLTGLGQGLYKIVITYNTSCKAQATYTLSDPTSISVSTTTTTNYNGQPISCNGAHDANIKATGSGGTGSLTFSWSTGATGSLLTGVGAGSYQAIVTDQNSCTGTHSITLTDPSAVSGTITGSNHSGYGVSCNGKNDGSLSVVGTGGTGIYNYVWSSGQHTAGITSLVAASYSATVTDNNGCSGIVIKLVTQPPVLNSPVSSHQDLSCFHSSDGVIALTPSGGTGGYQYSKDNGITWTASPTFNSLSAGNYTLITKDSNSCTASASLILTEPAKLTISFANITPALCSAPQGGANSVVNGGVVNYQYSWANSLNQIVGTNANLTNVLGDVYTLTVKDANNCTANNSVTITSTDGAQATWTTTSSSCNYTADGGAAITINSGQGPFVVLWPDGQQTLQVQNMKGALYHVKITDGNNCTVIEDVTIPSPPPLQLATNNIVVPTCTGDCDGKMTLAASGGTGSYNYTWNGQSLAQQTNLCAATYPVIVHDANNCELKQDVILSGPAPLSITTVSQILPSCNGLCDGSLEITGLGGNGGYQYVWADGGTGTVRNNLCSNTYTITVTDIKNCSAQKNVVLDEVPPIVVNLGGGATVCSGQKYTLDAGQGWTNIAWSSTDTDFSSASQKVTVSKPGHYIVAVKDLAGCSGSGSFFLQTSTDLLQASFLIPATAEAQDTVAIIEISWPLPESIDWDLPPQMTMITDMGDVIFGQFNDVGTYTIGLTAHLGDCLATTSKTITIDKRTDVNSGGRLGYDDFLKSFVVYPNPTDGSFDVGVDLAGESAIVLSVWSSSKGTLIDEVTDNDKNSYSIHFDLRPLASGSYVIRLDHAKGKSYIRFIVD